MVNLPDGRSCVPGSRPDMLQRKGTNPKSQPEEEKDLGPHGNPDPHKDLKQFVITIERLMDDMIICHAKWGISFSINLAVRIAILENELDVLKTLIIIMQHHKLVVPIDGVITSMMFNNDAEGITWMFEHEELFDKGPFWLDWWGNRRLMCEFERAGPALMHAWKQAERSFRLQPNERTIFVYAKHMRIVGDLVLRGFFDSRTIWRYKTLIKFKVSLEIAEFEAVIEWLKDEYGHYPEMLELSQSEELTFLHKYKIGICREI
jgi:hypothetical protein